MRKTKEEIIIGLYEMKKRVVGFSDTLLCAVSLLDYSSLVYHGANGYEIWTRALQKAVFDNETVIIPPGIYYIDSTIVIPSKRKILANGAHIKKVPEMNTLLFRNEHLTDGSHKRVEEKDCDFNISIVGGIYEDTGEKWTFHHGLYDKDNGMPGVSACMCFINVRNLIISDVKIIRAGGFGIQLGYLTDGVIERVRFENTVADGVHINGHTKNLLVRDVSGSVGDDIVAFNAYDWSASSVAFGPIENLFCENIALSHDGRYKAIRILPGVYYYDNGEREDCYIKDVIIKGVRGVNTFKFYFQTPPYKIGQSAERGEGGRGDNLFIEDVEMDLYKPIDAFSEYLDGDKILGTFAAFELGSYFGRIEFSDIQLKIYKDKFPTSYFVSIGPKSIIRDGKEIFDPQENSVTKELILKNVSVNKEKLSSENIGKYIHEIVFDNLYTGAVSQGKIENITFA